jgi:hypothetical protein
VKAKELDVALDLDIAAAGADQSDDRVESLGLRRRVARQPVCAVCFDRGRTPVGCRRVVDSDDEAFGVVKHELIPIANKAGRVIHQSATGGLDLTKGKSARPHLVEM